MSRSSSNTTELFARVRSGDEGALEELFPIVYDELRAVAARYMRREYERQTLQATALVNEAYLKLVPDGNLRWNDRAHFLALVARSMRQILVERARARHAGKRGGEDARPVTLHDELLGGAARDIDVLALHEALGRLGELDRRQAELVELRFFGGLTVEETAEAMGISPATVKRDWAFAQAWLRRHLGG